MLSIYNDINFRSETTSAAEQQRVIGLTECVCTLHHLIGSSGIIFIPYHKSIWCTKTIIATTTVAKATTTTITTTSTTTTIVDH